MIELQAEQMSAYCLDLDMVVLSRSSNVPGSSPQSSLLSLQVVQFQLPSQAEELRTAGERRLWRPTEEDPETKGILMSAGFSRSRSKRVSLGEAEEGERERKGSRRQFSHSIATTNTGK
jgi:hypothetical protein